MTLTDAGPLVALIDADEPDHQRCRAALAFIALPMVTTWPAFTEAMYLLGRAGGTVGQDALWRLVFSDRLVIAPLSDAALSRTARLMTKYSDLPMDLADGTLVALAEERELSTVFTLDDDFRVYRRHGRRTFQIVPG